MISFAEEVVPKLVDGQLVNSENGEVLYDVTKVVDMSVIAALMAVVIISLVVGIYLVIRNVRKYEAKVGVFFIGIIGYFVARLLYEVIQGVCYAIFGARAYTSNVMIVVIAIIGAALMVFGRYFLCKGMQMKYTGIGNSLMMGLGFGFGSILPGLVQAFSQTIVCQAITQAGGFGKLLPNVSAEELYLYAQNYDFLFKLTPTDVMYDGVYNMLILALTMYSTVIMYAIYNYMLDFKWNFAILGVYALIAVLNDLGIDGTISITLIALVSIVSIRYIFYISSLKLGNLLKGKNVTMLGTDIDKARMSTTFKKKRK